MKKSDSIKELAAALAKAQGEIENATKNSANPHFRSKYADLAEILNTVRPVMAKYGLSVAQFPTLADNIASVETILMHASGEWLSSTASSPLQKFDVQGIGSVTTYLRRYSLAAVCGIAQEDDDGNAAARPAQAEAPKVSTISYDQAKQLIAAAARAGMTEDEFCKTAHIENLSAMQASRFQPAMNHLANLAAKREAQDAA